MHMNYSQIMSPRLPLPRKVGGHDPPAPMGAPPLDTVRSPVPNFTFIGAEMWEYSPHNCKNFEFWPEICTSGATRLQYFLRNSQHLYASIGTF